MPGARGRYHCRRRHRRAFRCLRSARTRALPTPSSKNSRALGGVIETRQWEDCVLECGPDSFISAKPEAMTLITGAGPRGRRHRLERRTARHLHPASRKAGPPARGRRRCSCPRVPVRCWRRRLSAGERKSAWAWSSSAGPKTYPDRSVSEFVTDHFGRETLDYLAEPLLSGVYGGDPDQLSVASVLPRFVEMERTQGSLARTLMAARTRREAQRASVPNLEERPGMPDRKARGEGERVCTEPRRRSRSATVVFAYA